MNKGMQYEQINLEDYIQSGEGGTSLTYNHKDGRSLAKLFLKGYGSETSEHEFLISKVVYGSGIPTPRPIRLITDGERFGAEYELIPGKRSFTRVISQEPDKLVPLSERFAVLAKEIHRTPADTTILPDMKEIVREWILKFKQMPEVYKSKLLRFLDTVPEATTCLHGDLHIGNIITDGTRDLWIDVGDFSYGVPEWDLGMMYHATHSLSAERADNIFHLDLPTLKAHWDAFARVYFNTDSEEELEREVKRLFPFLVTKMIFIISKIKNGEGPLSEYSRGLIDLL
ncbi:MAG: TIGR02172 family protein [Bacteroidales bacterium]|nr:TIGR02172 family protein [Bacteroidales bacterium]